MHLSIVDIFNNSKSRKVVLFFIAILLPFFKPGSIAELNIRLVEIIYAAAEVVVAVGTACFFIKNMRRAGDSLLISALVLAGLVLLSTLLNGQSVRNWLGQWAPKFVIVLLSCCAMKKNPVEYIAAVLLLSSTLCVINLFTVVMFPDGMYQTPSTFVGDNFFLGHRNGTGIYILLMVVSSLILDNYKNEAPVIGSRTRILFFIGLIQTLLAFCATTLISLIIIFAGLCALNSNRMRSLLNPLIALVIGLAGNISVVILRVQALFAPFIENVLHRDTSLSSRTIIWDITFDLLSGWNSVIGRGVDGYQNIRIRDTTISSAHNELMNIALQSGLLGLFVYAAFVGCVVCRSFTHRKQALGMITALYLVTIFVMGITYITTTTATFLALSILFYSMSD